MSCPTCQKMDTRHKAIRVSQFVLSTLKPMQRIAMDTRGPLDIAKQFRYIIVIIDTFTCYVELFPTKDVSAEAATAAAPWRHSCRFGTPLEIMTDYGTQFMNKTLEEYSTPQQHTILQGGKRHSGTSEQVGEPPHTEHLIG